MLDRFLKEEFNRRVRRVRKGMESRNLDLLLVYSSSGAMRYGQRGHVLYLTGYEPYFGDCMMLLPVDRDIEPLLQIDEANYFPSECTWVERIQTPQDPIDTLDAYATETRLSDSVVGVVGEYSMSPHLLRRLENLLGHSRLALASDLLEDLRAVKSEYEIGCVRHACEIAKKGFQAAAEKARPGISDAEVVMEMERACREAGAQDFPHHTMFSSGSDRHYAEWWWYCGKRKMRSHDLMTADFGTMYRSYCCDMARSFSLGSASKEKRETYEVILEAERAGQDAARPGAMASEVDSAAARVLEVFSRWVTSGEATDIGHGVGLEVHEWPFLGYQHIRGNPVYADRELKENMVISIEPQVYHPKFGLLQIEDQFRVTSRGGEVLTSLPRELIEC